MLFVPTAKTDTTFSINDSVAKAKTRSPVSAYAFALIPLSLIIICFAIYAPIIQNFFVSDDWTHVVWLRRAVVDPELLLRNFHACWLDIQSCQFYRPIISVTLFLDYLLWKENAIGYHVTNVAFHAASAIFLYFLLSQIEARSSSTSRHSIWPAASAILFAVYPLHPEVVSWVTGRVDSVTTAFFFLGLWCYTRWRAGNGARWGIATAVAVALALGSKETALALVPSICALDFFLFSAEPNFIRRGLNVIARNWWLCALLSVYFVVRFISLGTWLGGYDNTLGFAGGIQALLPYWWQGVSKLVLPINESLIKPGYVWSYIWLGMLALNAVATIFVLSRNAESRKQFVFIAALSFLCVIPIYKLFSVMPDLQGSRMTYLVSAPVCALFCFGLSKLCQDVKSQKLKALLVVALLVESVSCGVILVRNNKAWVAAAHEMTSIRQASAAASISDPRRYCLFTDLPDHVFGAYVGRNALGGMIELSKKPASVLMHDDKLGYLKPALGSQTDQLAIYKWQGPDKGYAKVTLRPDAQGNVGAPALPAQLEGRGIVSAAKGDTGNWKFAISPHAGELAVNPPANCWDVDFVEVVIRRLDANLQDNTLGLRLSNQFVDNRECWQPVPADNQFHTVRFNLHQNQEWAFGGKCRNMSLLFRSNAQYEIASVRLLPAEAVLPALYVPGNRAVFLSGYLTLRSRGANFNKEWPFTGDASAIPGVASLLFEFTQANSFFDEENSSSLDRRVLKAVKASGAKGAVTVKRSDFVRPGSYLVRVRAVNAAGVPVGPASDHINVVAE